MSVVTYCKQRDLPNKNKNGEKKKKHKKLVTSYCAVQAIQAQFDLKVGLKR